MRCFLTNLPRTVHFISKHHVFILCGCSYPCCLRSSLQYVPPEWLQYSNKFLAASIPLVPRLTAIITSELTAFVQSTNSFVPTSFVSITCHASSRRRVRLSLGPTPSSQL